MKRVAFAATLLLGATALATGCRSCQSPYDYTPPVANCECVGATGCGHGRVGSVLSGGYANEPVYDYESVPHEGESYEVVPN
jgi:hypothetical protein